MEQRKLTEILQEFLSKNQDLKWNTLRSYKAAWNNLIEAIGDKDISKVTFNDIEDFRSWLFTRKHRPSAIDSRIRNAKPVMAWAVRRNYREDNPFQGLRMPKVPQKQIIVYTEAELCAMLRCANLLWQTRIVAAASAGLRKGEILNLTINDIDFDNECIIVQSKESTKQTWPWSPKNWKSRQVPLSKQLVYLFAKRMDELPEGYPYIMLNESRYYGLQQMRKPIDGKPRELKPRLCLTPDENFKPFKTILRKSDVDDSYKFKYLRNTAITNWLLTDGENKLAPQEVQKLAGHQHIETTMTYYAACRSDIAQRARINVGATGLEPATS